MALGLALISGAPSAWLIDHMIKNDVYDKKSEILPKIQTFIRGGSILASILSFALINVSDKFPILIAGLISIAAGIF